ncbi:MAG: hypothetical protein AAB924_00725 [Patescibacteria group bacterium]
MTQCHSVEFSIRKLSPTTGKMNEVNFLGEQANCFACVWELKAVVMFFQQKKQTRRGSGNF